MAQHTVKNFRFKSELLIRFTAFDRNGRKTDSVFVSRVALKLRSLQAQFNFKFRNFKIIFKFNLK